MMSANITAASTPCRRTGWSVTSAQSSGVCATSQNECRSRIARYSGSDRPACRMNQHGRALDRLAPGGPDEERLHPRSRLVAPCRRDLSPSAGARRPTRRRRRARVEHRPRRARERRHDRLGRRHQPRLPLARRPRQPDRLGRLAHAARRRSRPASARPSRSACARRSRPARYRLAFDLVAERRAWFSELGSPMLVARRRRRASARASRAPRSRTRSSRRPTGRSASAPRTPRATASSRARSSGPAACCTRARARSPTTSRARAASRASRAPLLCPSVLAGHRARAARRRRRPARLRGAARRAVGLRRADRAQSSTAIRSSTRVKTNAPSDERDRRGDDEVDHVGARAAGDPTRSRRARRRSAARAGCPSAAPSSSVS